MDLPTARARAADRWGLDAFVGMAVVGRYGGDQELVRVAAARERWWASP